LFVLRAHEREEGNRERTGKHMEERDGTFRIKEREVDMSDVKENTSGMQAKLCKYTNVAENAGKEK
jgi:hypothetical protein